MLQRLEADDALVGMMGNWISIEALIATGAVDLFAVDMNCSSPSLEAYAKKYPTTFVSVSPLVNVPGVEMHIDYAPEKVASQAIQLTEIAMENFRNRRGKPTHVPKKVQPAIVGFSIESILETMGGTLDPLLDAIKAGSIRGIVGLVSCTSLGNGPQDSATIAIAKELIKKDIRSFDGVRQCGRAARRALHLGGPRVSGAWAEGHLQDPESPASAVLRDLHGHWEALCVRLSHRKRAGR